MSRDNEVLSMWPVYNFDSQLKGNVVLLKSATATANREVM